ncbi:MAG: LysE family transporter [Anaerolineae bacterium]
MGIGAIRTRVDMSKALDLQQMESLYRVYVAGLFITLLNPLTIVGWLALAGNFFETVWRPDWPPKDSVGLVAIFVILLGVQTWSLGLAAVLSSIRKAISPNVLKWVSVISGVLLIGYGLAAWRSALGLLFNF